VYFAGVFVEGAIMVSSRVLKEIWLVVFTTILLSGCASHRGASSGPTGIISGSGSDTLSQAIALIGEGRPQQAHDLIATIHTNDSQYGLAKIYNAICLYDLNDYRGFLKGIKNSTNQAEVPANLREDLAFKEIGALYECRQFEELIPKSTAFAADFPTSPDLRATGEYRMASVFESGVKNANDAFAVQNDANQFNKRWWQSQTNLNEFLTWAQERTNYVSLPKRSFQKDIWTAQIILGDDEKAWQEIQDNQTREDFSFLRIVLSRRLHKDQLDNNIALLSQFLTNYPASFHIPKVVFELADFTFHKGKQICLDADTAEKTGDLKTSQSKRMSAQPFFDYARSLQPYITMDKTNGIELTDVLDYRDDMLESYYLERDYAGLLNASDSLLAESTYGDEGWEIARLYHAIGLLAQRKPNAISDATPILDEILAQGFQNKPEHDHWLIPATKWRIYVAQQTGDNNKIVQLVKAVHDANCAKNMKAEFLKTYGAIGGF
jgi:hypothetical protein